MSHPAEQNIIVFNYEKEEPTYGDKKVLCRYTVAWKKLDEARCTKALERIARYLEKADWDRALEKDKSFERHNYIDPATGKTMAARQIHDAQGNLLSHYYWTDNKLSNTGPLGVAALHFIDNKKVCVYQMADEEGYLSDEEMDRDTRWKLTREVFGEQVDDFMTYFGIQTGTAAPAPKHEQK